MSLPQWRAGSLLALQRLSKQRTGLRGRRRRRSAAALAMCGALALSGPAWAADGASPSDAGTRDATQPKTAPSVHGNDGIPAPPEPAAAENRRLPLENSSSKVDLSKDVSGIGTGQAPRTRHLANAAPALPSSAVTFGTERGRTKTLVLFDSTGEYAKLGEFYALGASTLATHSGRVTTLPVGDYRAGLAGAFDGVIYVGSIYDEKLPRAFVDDVLTGDVPILWSGFNIWQLASTDADRQAFIARFGWDPATSYIDSVDKVHSVSYKGQTLTRSKLNESGILAPHIINPAAVNVLATANCGDGAPAACDQVAQSGGHSTFPWAVRSSNLTYTGEIPLTYIDEKDRYLAYADLILDVTGSGKNASAGKAAVRIEDVSPQTTVQDLKPIVDYLIASRVPFQIATIPFYVDPKGEYNNFIPVSKTFDDNPELLKLLKYAQANGGVIVQHGTTHQYNKIDNPYNGVSGDDFEFYRSWCTEQQSGGQAVKCQQNSWVQLVGPVPDDSVNWARYRVEYGRAELQRVGLGAPTVFETPHYAASKAAYQGIGKVYRTRYERVLFFPGTVLPSNRRDTGHFGQFFPYTITDVGGTRVLPENLGNYEPDAYNNHPPRTGADLVENARANLVVRDGNASFFFHPGYPVTELQTAVEGIRGLGYTFVPATELN